MKRNQDKLPDGWIRTPMPPQPRTDTPDSGWFARTGEPAPPRTARQVPEGPGSTGTLALGILVAGLVFVGGIAVLGLFLIF